MSTNNLSDCHAELFHYTDEQGLRGILESQFLRATHWQYLNDTSELSEFQKLIPSLIKTPILKQTQKTVRNNQRAMFELIKLGGMEDYVENRAKFFAQIMHETTVHPTPSEQHFEFYITSFCVPGGSTPQTRRQGTLSQWRYYGNKGYALVFNTKELEHLMRQEYQLWNYRISLGEVGYGDESQEVLFDKVPTIPKFIAAFENCRFKNESDCQPILEPLMDCCIHYKNGCFAEEKEIRLVAVLNGQKIINSNLSGLVTQKPEPARYELTKEEFPAPVPYIQLFDKLQSGTPARLPITQIIVGPGSDQVRRESVVQGILNSLGLTIEVTCSDMPVRL